jgi:hypothetical protein
MNGRFAVGLGLCSVLLFMTTPASGQDPHPREPVLTTPHFALYSDYHFNLHDALVAAGTARRAGQPEAFAAEPDATCFGGLPAAQRAAWNRAVDYYAEIIATGGSFDQVRMLPRLELLFRNDDWARGDDGTFIAITRSFRAAAAPAYERCRWQAQDARNRRWIEALQPVLAKHEEAISRRLVELYGADWKALPIPVDVVETVPPVGGDSINTTPPPGHIWVSSSRADYQAPADALELVFHEASHLLAGSPLFVELESAGRAAERALPPLLWHAVLFYTTGEAVRRTLASAGEPEHTPLIYALNIFGEVRDPIAAAWSPYLDGERSLPEAATALVQALDAAR